MSMIDAADQPSGAAPALSIIIPSYNVAPYIEAAILSALDQTFTDLEVIVVNDGSTDETPAVIARVAADRADPRLRIINRVNGGLSAARNTGIAAARGDFIGFLDSDDIWHPTKAQKQMTRMLADPTIGIGFSYSAYIEEGGEPTGGFLFAKKMEPTLHDMIRRNHIGNGSTPIVRRECFDRAGVFREELKSCEDYEMWCRILWSTDFRAEAIGEPLTSYRLRDSSLSFNFDKFILNADLAMAALRVTMKNVPERLFRAGHAEHYRVAAWKAALTGQDKSAISLLLKSLRLWPWLILYDFHAGATAFALFLPRKPRQRLMAWYKSLRTSQVTAVN
ncbi:MAG TPA: glycosyltransferase family 2 protein [Dongiaceae bacterium]|nr:glycosyltransferase family 2 protein [Dongiaceae bacterium]